MNLEETLGETSKLSRRLQSADAFVTKWLSQEHNYSSIQNCASTTPDWLPHRTPPHVTDTVKHMQMRQVRSERSWVRVCAMSKNELTKRGLRLLIRVCSKPENILGDCRSAVLPVMRSQGKTPKLPPPLLFGAISAFKLILPGIWSVGLGYLLLVSLPLVVFPASCCI